MSLHLNGNTIGDLYVGGTKVGEAWFNGQKVYSSVPPFVGIKYLFRDIDANGNLTLATGALEDASEITQIGDYGLYNAFAGCKGLTGSVSFPALTSIGSYGLYYAFIDCSGLTGSVSFPNLTTIGFSGLNSAFSGCGITSISFPALTTIGREGLQHAFAGCKGLTSVSFPALTSIGEDGLFFTFSEGITEVHFKSSLSGNSQCDPFLMGCTNATVYFDL